MDLNYVLPNGIVVKTQVDCNMEGYENWLASMIRGQDDIIFFYTIPTTDIF